MAPCCGQTDASPTPGEQVTYPCASESSPPHIHLPKASPPPHPIGWRAAEVKKGSTSNFQPALMFVVSIASDAPLCFFPFWIPTRLSFWVHASCTNEWVYEEGRERESCRSVSDSWRFSPQSCVRSVKRQIRVSVALKDAGCSAALMYSLTKTALQ